MGGRSFTLSKIQISMIQDELREMLHREMLCYYFAQREPMLEIRKDESLMSAVWRKMQPYAACGFPRAITESDVEMLCNSPFARLFQYDLKKGAEKITQLRDEYERVLAHHTTHE